MFRGIKRSLKYLAILIGIAILIPSCFYFIIRIPEVQTFIVRRITGNLSDRIKSTITVGKVNYSFFNKLSLNDVLIKDPQNDTLLYSKKIVAGIRWLDLRKKIIRFGQIELTNPYFAMITDTSGVSNLKWYLDMLGGSGGKSEKSNSKSSISISQIGIKDGRFLLLNKNRKKSNLAIDFGNIRLSGINGDIDNLRIENDSTLFRVNDLEFAESSGFIVRSLNSRFSIAKNNISLTNLFLYCDSSIINADWIEMKPDSAGFKNFEHDVRLDIKLQKSLISTADLKYFVPAIRSYEESAELSGRISGTIAELRGREIRLSYGKDTRLECNFDISGLPRIEDSYIHIGVTSLMSNARDFENLKAGIKIPPILFTLGTISFSGSFTGFTNDFVTYGTIGTDMGEVHTDLSLKPEGKGARVKGLMSCRNIKLGELTGKKDLLGDLSMEANVNGFASSLKKISGNLTGKIDSVEINRYIYHNVTINGLFTEKTWDGNIKVADSNIKMDMLGLLDFSKNLPEFDFTLNLSNANLYRLNLDKKDTTSNLSALVTANFTGNNIDNLSGEIRMLNSTFEKYGNKLEMYDFSLKAFSENNKPAITLRTDFANADLRGYYNFAELQTIFRNVLSTLMPSIFPASVKKSNGVRNNFAFNVNFRNTDKINRFFKTGFQIADKSTLSGIIIRDSVVNIEGASKQFVWHNNTFSDVAVDAVLKDNRLTAGVKSSSLSVLGQSDLKNFKAGIKTNPDNFIFNIDWDNKEKILDKGNFTATGVFVKNPVAGKSAILKIDIDSSDLYTGNNLWKIDHSTIELDTNSVRINNFFIHNGDHSYTVNGAVSEDPRDTLHVRFRGIDLSPLSKLTEKPRSGQPGIPLKPKGIVNGNILVTNAIKNPLVEADIKISAFSLLGADYGDVTIRSNWNTVRKVADIRGYNILNNTRNFDLTGYYDPSTKWLNLDAQAINLPVNALNPLLSFFASDISGTATGKLNLSGRPGSFVLKGDVFAKNTSLKINYLQAIFTLNDSIQFDRTGIHFKNDRLVDEKGNIAYLSGSIYNKYFKDYVADLAISMNNCLVLNTQSKNNELFYGTAYASGVATIKSGPNILSIDVSAKSDKGTKVYIPLNSSMTMSEHSFVTFVNPDSLNRENINKPTPPPKQSGSSVIELNLDLDVTPDAEIQLLIDPKAGDVIRGRGNGKLNISLNRKGEFKIYGDYTVTQGDYLFTLQSILNKRFDVENGGKITFNGNLEDAEIDLVAGYKNLRTSLYPILPIEIYNVRTTVEPQVHLTGKLFNPVVTLGIVLPNADEETKTYFANAISTEEELSRQFLFLLVMNSFYPDPAFKPPSATALSTSPATSTTAMAVTTTEMLSNQLSNWLSQISKDFDVGFNYRPGNKDINTQEVEVALSTQLLNNKLAINGNFDVRGANNAYENPLSGDFDIEYKLAEKIRFKVFNRYNNFYTGMGASYTQGLGLFFQQEFNKLSDLFGKKNKSEMKKEEQPEVKKRVNK